MRDLLKRAHKQITLDDLEKRVSRGESENLRLSRVRITSDPPSEELMAAMLSRSRILTVKGQRATDDAV